ncbi:cAMP-regulated phosphoprotein 21 [Larimichthys crocea]|uniref:Uncharacterized protein n=1 Tax=Larimichthys crocea TaxID=215358 RepID=A0ACD3RG98_LARCR|nr:cAMP-regulated phosphoprotein 21 [Larimichthys crocea]
MTTTCHHDSEKAEQQKHCNQVQPKKKVKAKGKLVRSMAVCEESSPLEEIQPSPDTNTTSSCHDNERTSFPLRSFPHMSSYHRMLVHRVAAYFGMEHNVDQTGKSVIINRTSSTRIPEQRFLDELHKDKTEEVNRWKIILKRDSSSDDQTRIHPLRERQSKSMEEREEEYQRVRDRIFNQEQLCTQESGHAETRAVEDYNPYAETQRRRQLFRGSRDSSGSSWTGSSRQSSTETDCRYSNDPHPWSSTDSDSSYQWTSPAPKPRQPANHSWDTRGSGSIALYRLPSTCPHPASPPNIDEPAPNSAYIMENGIPPGSILVNPHTGQPFLNPDGTPAVYNPPDTQQPIRSQTQLQSSPSQQQVAQPGYAPAVGVQQQQQQQSSHTQAQAVLGTYSPMASHQRSMVQGGVSVSYPQSKVVTAVGGEAGYCCVVPPPSHHSSCHPPSCNNLSAPAWSAQY